MSARVEVGIFQSVSSSWTSGLDIEDGARVEAIALPSQLEAMVRDRLHQVGRLADGALDDRR